MLSWGIKAKKAKIYCSKSLQKLTHLSFSYSSDVIAYSPFLIFVFHFFLMLSLLRRASFWPTSMVYISVIIIHILQFTLIMKKTFCGQLSCCTASTPVFFKFESGKTLALAGIWTHDLRVTKPMCYQLSYQGLDMYSLFHFHQKKCMNKL